MMDTETNDKAIDALNDLEKVFGEGLTPHGWEMFDTIRQALTPQSSADLGRVREVLQNTTNIPIESEDSQWRAQAIDEALDLLDQQPAHIQGDGGKGLIDQQTSAGHKFTVNDEGLAVCDHCKEPMTFPVKKCFGLLTELKAAVEGMRKKLDYPVITLGQASQNERKEIYNAACDQFQHLIDEMIRRG